MIAKTIQIIGVYKHPESQTLATKIAMHYERSLPSPLVIVVAIEVINYAFDEMSRTPADHIVLIVYNAIDDIHLEILHRMGSVIVPFYKDKDFLPRVTSEYTSFYKNVEAPMDKLIAYLDERGPVSLSRLTDKYKRALTYAEQYN
jgi:hypothetical protein